MSKRIFLVGDFESNTGPAIANKALKKALGKRANYSQARNKVGRMFELVQAIMRSQVICFCGFSELNVYGIKLAKLFGKKTAYLMHGYIELEAKINHANTSPKRLEAERYVLEHVDKIICVSNLLAEKVRAKYPKRKGSIYVVYDIVEPIKLGKKNIKRNKYQIMSTGGGMPRKNNLVVCEAIEKVNAGRPKNKQLSYIVTGKSYGMRNEFKKFEFVQFLGEVSHEKCLRLMQESALYIQNSYFETFGMALIEALELGCDLLLASNIGANEIIRNLSTKSIINDTSSVDEIAKKISLLIDEKSFTNRLSVRSELINSESVAKKLLAVLERGYHD